LKEAALLIESGSFKLLDHLILVTADKAQRVNRIVLRDPERDKEQILAIMDKQISQAEALKYADSIIQNDEKTPLLENVLGLHNKLLKLASNSNKL
jgi:dephospho-CoA kinase